MIANLLVEKAMKKAQGAQAAFGRSESLKVSFENDRLKSVSSSQSTGMSVKVVVDGKLGSSHTTEIDDVDDVVERAWQAAEFGSPAHFEFPGLQDGSCVKIYDDAVLGVTKEQMVGIGDEMIAVVKEYNSEILVDAGVSKSVGNAQFANSAGMTYTTDSSSFGVGVNGQWVRGTDILSAGHGFGWRKQEIDHGEIARKAVHLFSMAERAAQVQSGHMPVIFTPEGVNVLLLALRLGFNGKNVLLGASPLAGKLEYQIADDRLSLYDNPLIDYASGSGKYDGEGVPHQVTPLIDRGVVTNFLYDLDTAGRAGTKTTGNGTGCGPTNLVVQQGDTTYEEMLKDTKEGLLVHNVLGLGQGNPISGEFSVNVQLGYKVENGEVVGRVKDVMLAGNTYDALKDIAAIGDRAEWASGTLLTPAVKISRLSVVAR